MYDPRGVGALLVGLYALQWINKNMEKWLGEKSTADTLSQSVDNNVTSEMGFALLEVHLSLILAGRRCLSPSKVWLRSGRDDDTWRGYREGVWFTGSRERG